MVVREENHPLGTHCMSDKTKHRVWASFPVWLGKSMVDISATLGGVWDTSEDPLDVKCITRCEKLLI